MCVYIYTFLSVNLYSVGGMTAAFGESSLAGSELEVTLNTVATHAPLQCQKMPSENDEHLPRSTLLEDSSKIWKTAQAMEEIMLILAINTTQCGVCAK